MSQFYRRIHRHDFDLTQYLYPILSSPGEELKYFFHSERADSSDSRNLMGLQNAAVNDLLDQLIHATTREQQQVAMSALDRVLLWEHVAIPNWHGYSHKVTYWKHLQHPREHPKYGFRLTTWWMDKATGR